MILRILLIFKINFLENESLKKKILHQFFFYFSCKIISRLYILRLLFYQVLYNLNLQITHSIKTTLCKKKVIL